MIGWDRLPHGGSGPKHWDGSGPHEERFRIVTLREEGRAVGAFLTGDRVPPEGLRFPRVEEAKAHALTLVDPHFRRAVWPDHPWGGRAMQAPIAEHVLDLVSA
jgi:hypothetical protein